ncbi:MAG TPA: hypothetical protein VIH91_00210 [Terriglobales bacterium]
MTDEAKTIQASRLIRHKTRRRKRIALRVVFILALIVCGLAVSDFAYNAYRRTDCLTGGEFDQSGIKIPAPVPSDVCIAELADRDERLRLDATIAAVAVAFLLGSTVLSRRMKSHRR